MIFCVDNFKIYYLRALVSNIQVLLHPLSMLNVLKFGVYEKSQVTIKDRFIQEDDDDMFKKNVNSQSNLPWLATLSPIKP